MWLTREQGCLKNLAGCWPHPTRELVCLVFGGVKISTHRQEKQMNIYVGNLPYTATEDELEALFAEHGPVVRVNIISDRETGRSKGFGFIEMTNQPDGEKAIEALDGADLQGRSLKVNEARPREERPKRDNW